MTREKSKPDALAEARVPMRGGGADQLVVVLKAINVAGAKGLNCPAEDICQPFDWEEPMSKAKPFEISKQVVWAAYKRVKANQGAAGVDGQSVTIFEKDLRGNLYKLWNRMSSGSYFPPPVRLVEIPKGVVLNAHWGSQRSPNRIAQTVARMYLEPLVEPKFHPDSYGVGRESQRTKQLVLLGRGAGVRIGL